MCMLDKYVNDDDNRLILRLVLLDGWRRDYRKVGLKLNHTVAN